jgi:hypothetical protein
MIMAVAVPLQHVLDLLHDVRATLISRSTAMYFWCSGSFVLLLMTNHHCLCAAVAAGGWMDVNGACVFSHCKRQQAKVQQLSIAYIL